MNDASALREWGELLRACPKPRDIARCLARAVHGMSMGEACSAGVFLFDVGREYLLLEGCHPDVSEAMEVPAVPAWELDDPLAYSVHSGAACRVESELYAVLPPSLELLAAGRGEQFRSACAEPLIAPGGEIIGGVVAAFQETGAAVCDHVRMLLDYGSALLETRILQTRQSSMLSGIREDFARLEREARQARRRPESVILGQSDAMEAVRSMVLNVADSDAPVLITGETGTGKEVVATAIHNASPRCNAPFVQINCAALPANLLESELFGHRRGAFSGADSDHPGLLRSANGGTILLDEIGEMPPEVQSKLLRVLQEHTVRPVGDVRSLAVNIRFLAATNLDMDQAVERGIFRRDLFHRLALVHLKLPPLRERPGDLPVLARHHLAELAIRYQRPGLSIAPEVWPALSALSYRGNVREFFSMLERAVIMTDKDTLVLSAGDLLENESVRKHGVLSLADLVRSYEASVILEVMKFYGNKTRDAARALGVPIRTLNHKLSRIGGSAD